jgi:hypothetical protein
MVAYYECIDWCLYQVVYFLDILQRWFRNVKAFEKTIEFSRDVLQRNVTAANPTPKRT